MSVAAILFIIQMSLARFIEKFNDTRKPPPSGSGPTRKEVFVHLRTPLAR